jgi:FixJ family two-component response regulator
MWVVQGYSNRGIATQLSLSVKTVETYRVLYAVRAGSFRRCGTTF